MTDDQKNNIAQENVSSEDLILTDKAVTEEEKEALTGFKKLCRSLRFHICFWGSMIVTFLAIFLIMDIVHYVTYL